MEEKIEIDGVRMSLEAARSIEWAGVDVADDVAQARRGLTREALLARCLEGCEPEHENDWGDYVDAVFAHAKAVGP